ncbi:fungal-specific transcription factor domain-containing protein, partial [Pyrenochaeta sp. MPI-SDFR-AT-0127]
EFIRLYLHYIHDRPHSLFHEQSLWDEVRDGTLPECLLTAICAMGCRFSPHERHRNLAATFRSNSKSLLAQNLEDICIPNVQACILLANSYAAEQDNALEALYFGIANRMAYVLGLHKQDAKDPPILRETKSRVWWSLFMADRWCPPGLGLPRQIIRSTPEVEMPMDEVDFQMLRSAGGPSLLKSRTEGLWAYNISLVYILDSIQDINISLVQGQVDRSTIDYQVERIADRLQGWHDSLPRSMVMNDQNLDMYKKKGYGGTFVALHLGYHHYSTLLYFQYLEPECEPTQKTVAYAARCRHHGLAYSRLVHTSRELGDCHVVYLTVAHMTIVSSSVLLHLLLFGNKQEMETARTQLTLNFEALMDLAKFWPCVDRMKERLFIFQNACLRSSAAKTYAVDRWIVRFLLEYA